MIVSSHLCSVRLTPPRLVPAVVLSLLVVTLSAAPAVAQPAMPDLRSMSGKPLPVPDLPPGTVVVRLARKTPQNAAVGVEITATTKGANGDSRNRSAKTGPDGRATFDGIAPGSEFHATAEVDGERLETSRFPVPSGGGTRVMLIAGLGAADPHAAPADPHAGAAPAETFKMGAPTGEVQPASDLPKGTLEITLKNAEGRPLAGRPVRLGEVKLTSESTADPKREVRVHDAVTDAEGKVRFTNLTTGETAGFAAVSDHEGMRLSTVPFRMPADTGMRGSILALLRTSDPSVLELDPQTKFVVDLREDALAVMIGLFIRNKSRQIFDAGEDGLVIPFPDGAVNAQEIEGGESIEIIPGKGVRLKTPIPPDAGAQFMTQIRYGYVLPANGDRTLDVRQPLPMALPDPFILVPANTGLRLDGSGLRALPADKDGRGDRVNVYTMPALPAGGTLALTVAGIPGRDRTGQTVAAGISLALAGVAIFLARRPGKSQVSGGPTSDELVDKREKIFGELVEIERQRKAEGANPRLDERRRETIGRLESVYRELAKAD